MTLDSECLWHSLKVLKGHRVGLGGSLLTDMAQCHMNSFESPISRDMALCFYG